MAAPQMTAADYQCDLSRQNSHHSTTAAGPSGLCCHGSRESMNLDSGAMDASGLETISFSQPPNGFPRGISGNQPVSKVISFRHHYPEGGWGWLICGCAFVVHTLTHGLQLSYGVMYVEVLRKYGSKVSSSAAWLGSFSTCVGLLIAPFIVAICRRKSTRLLAVVGGLVAALGCLFASFATQLHQLFLSYGLVLGLGVGITRETASLMIGQYFKKRRDFVELIVQSGGGIGVSLLSVFLKEVIRAIGWMRGLQALTALIFTTFILGIFYRSASLYHPRRRAILHLKNQKRRKEKCSEKPPYFDFSTLKMRPIQILMVSAGLAGFGIYTPLFFLLYHATIDGMEGTTLILLQTFSGFGLALGCCSFGFMVVRNNAKCFIARQYLCQTALVVSSLTLLAFTTSTDYKGYMVFVWIYGFFCGGYQYILKSYTYEIVGAGHMPRAWSFIEFIQSLPILLGVPLSDYLDHTVGFKTGYYVSAAGLMIGALALFLVNWLRVQTGPTIHIDPSIRDGLSPTQGPSGQLLDVSEICAGRTAAGQGSKNVLVKHNRHRCQMYGQCSELACISEEALDDDPLDDLPSELSACNKVEEYLRLNKGEGRFKKAKNKKYTVSPQNSTEEEPMKKKRPSITIIEAITTSL